MSDTVLIAAIAIAGPVLLAWLTGVQNRRMKREDWERQDRVADMAAQAAEKANLAAASIISANRETTKMVHEANVQAIGVNDKLNEIHGIVNSTHTTTLRQELAALELAEQLMQEDIARDIEEQKPQSVPKQKRLAATSERINALTLILRDRDKQQAAADIQASLKASKGQQMAADRQIVAADKQIEAAGAINILTEGAEDASTPPSDP